MQSYGLKDAHRTLNEARESLDSGSGEEYGPATVQSSGKTATARSTHRIDMHVFSWGYGRNDDDVGCGSAWSALRSAVGTTAFPSICCTIEDEIKRINPRHDCNYIHETYYKMQIENPNAYEGLKSKYDFMRPSAEQSTARLGPGEGDLAAAREGAEELRRTPAGGQGTRRRGDERRGMAVMAKPLVATG
ncbi:hypothetical protein [Oryza sativa Japonica Group]|uniref:Uncharacterized protein n=1 Tax=Oryza sativa subsp. japonica TaxID=39947 RepID=Q5JJZ3_ORYSJ|nr:hypothetical protein [Oryza sativa Japonica Group]